MKLFYTKKEVDKLQKELEDKTFEIEKKEETIKRLKRENEVYDRAIEEEGWGWRDTVKKLKEEIKILKLHKEDISSESCNKYRKKPVEVDAFQFYVDNMPDWFIDAVTNNTVILRKCDYKIYSIEEAYCEINTLEGVHRCNGGDYVIKGVKGELYPCKPDIFEMTYEKVEGN
jgi:predicted nuclease with TOPRIM domain